MQVYEINVTKTVTKQVVQFEPVKVEICLRAQLDEVDDYNAVVGDLMHRANAAITQGFGGLDFVIDPKIPMTGQVAEEVTPAPKRKRRSKAEVEADKQAEEAAKAPAPEATQAAEDPEPVVTPEVIVEAETASPVEVTDAAMMDAVNKAVRVIKPAGVRVVIEKFGVPRASEIPGNKRSAFLEALKVAVNK